MNPILDTALGYARLGIRIIPIKPGTKYPPINQWQTEPPVAMFEDIE